MQSSANGADTSPKMRCHAGVVKILINTENDNFLNGIACAIWQFYSTLKGVAHPPLPRKNVPFYATSETCTCGRLVNQVTIYAVRFKIRFKMIKYICLHCLTLHYISNYSVCYILIIVKLTLPYRSNVECWLFNLNELFGLQPYTIIMLSKTLMDLYCGRNSLILRRSDTSDCIHNNI